MNFKSLLTMIVMVMLSVNTSFALEHESIKFSHKSDKNNLIEVTFKGQVFDPGLDVLKSVGVVKDTELKKFHDFFRKMYENNKQGDRDSILSIWHPNDHDVIQAAMDDESLSGNKAIYKSIARMKINLIIQYGNYYICLVQIETPGQTPFVMKYPLTLFKGAFVLSNGLNGDYFYELISHYLDSTNYLPLLKQ